MTIPTTAPTGPGGLDLAALAQGSLGETQARTGAGKNLLAAALESMLQEQRGAITAGEEEQGREHSFTRAQAMLDEALAQRQAAMAAAARDAEPNWYEQQQFLFDQDVAKALLQRQWAEEDARAQAEASRPRLEEFGPEAIHPARGQAIMGDRRARQQYNIPKAARDYAREQLKKNPALRGDPAALGAVLYDYFSGDDFKGQEARKAGGGIRLRGLFGVQGPRIGGHGAREGRPDTRDWADERASILLHELLGGTVAYGG